MPTTFNVIPLGVQALIDPHEGDFTAEKAGVLEGLGFGGPDTPLWTQVQSLSPGDTGFDAGAHGVYDQNNAQASETFRIDGGPEQTFDAAAAYHATITYIDGTTAQITAVIFQDTAGNTYLAPEFSANADQTALEAGPIQALQLGQLAGNRFSGMAASRESFDYAVCFAEGTRIRVPGGERAVETLRRGDRVVTLDHGVQPIRWIRAQRVHASGRLAPVVLAPGALGDGLPSRELRLSRQHRVLVRSRVAEREFGAPEALVAAHRLAGLPGVRIAEGGSVAYWHFMCDRHEVVFAEGAPAETLFFGTEARRALPPEARAEILALFPELAASPMPSARPIPPGPRQRAFARRVERAGKPLLEPLSPPR